jgi:hypothetical protein
MMNTLSGYVDCQRRLAGGLLPKQPQANSLQSNLKGIPSACHNILKSVATCSLMPGRDDILARLSPS